MTPESVMTMGRHAVEVALMIAAPMLLVALAIGLVVSIFQAATQIQEQTLASTVKLVAVTLVLMSMGGWIGAQIMTFSQNIFDNFYIWSRGDRPVSPHNFYRW